MGRARNVVLLVLLPIAMLVNRSSVVSARPVPQTFRWRSNPVYSKQLASPTQVGSFYISAPVGFTLRCNKFQHLAEASTQYDWVGPTRADKTRPRFVVVVHKMLGASTHPNAKQRLDKEQNDFVALHYIHTRIQEGKINGMDFVRVYSQRDPKYKGTGKKYHGFQYMSAQGTVVISIVGDDFEPYYKSILSLSEAAALTFHK